MSSKIIMSQKKRLDIKKAKLNDITKELTFQKISKKKIRTTA